MSAREELAQIWADAYEQEQPVVDAILAAGYRRVDVLVEWAAAHAENGVVYNVYRTQDEAQAFVDTMAEVGHPMVIKRRTHTPATYTAWELQP